MVALCTLLACAPAAKRAPAPVASSAATAAPDAAAPQPEARDEDAEVAAAAKEWLDLMVEVAPEEASSLGLHGGDDRLGPKTPDAAALATARLEALLASLRSRFEARPLKTRTAKTDAAILIGTLAVETRYRRHVKPLERRPDAYTGSLAALYLMAARDYAPAAQRATHALARIDAIPAQLAAARTQLGAPPKVWTQIGIERARSAAAFFDEQRAFLEGALPGEKPRIAASLAATKKAFAEYATFLEHEVLPRSTGDFAVGADFFAFLLKNEYALDESADHLEERGRAIVASTVASMNALAKKIDPKANDWFSVVTRLKAKHPTAAELLPTYRREVARARKFLVDRDVVPFPDGDDLAVVETPLFERNTISAAYDAPPPFDPGTRGLFFVTPVDAALPRAKQEELLREHDFGDVVDTAVHEAYPGHHLQHSFARRHPSIVRKATGASIFAEGWGLYSEELMAELGYFTDEERLMQLEWTLVRAARVVIDVGLHTKGMSFDDAVKMLTDVAHLEKPFAISEVKRYTTDPTQPLSYLIGREMIFRIRDEYKARAGAAYSLKEFHREILSHGTSPPGLIEAEMFAAE